MCIFPEIFRKYTHSLTWHIHCNIYTHLSHPRNVKSPLQVRQVLFVQLLRTLSSWHYPHSPAARCYGGPCSNRSILPDRRAHSSSKPAAAKCGGRMEQTDRRTDRRMSDSFMDDAPHIMRAVPINTYLLMYCIHRVNWRHIIYGYDTIAILCV